MSVDPVKRSQAFEHIEEISKILKELRQNVKVFQPKPNWVEESNQECERLAQQINEMSPKTGIAKVDMKIVKKKLKQRVNPWQGILSEFRQAKKAGEKNEANRNLRSSTIISSAISSALSQKKKQREPQHAGRDSKGNKLRSGSKSSDQNIMASIMSEDQSSKQQAQNVQDEEKKEDHMTDTPSQTQKQVVQDPLMHIYLEKEYKFLNIGYAKKSNVSDIILLDIKTNQLKKDQKVYKDDLKRQVAYLLYDESEGPESKLDLDIYKLEHLTTQVNFFEALRTSVAIIRSGLSKDIEDAQIQNLFGKYAYEWLKSFSIGEKEKEEENQKLRDKKSYTECCELVMLCYQHRKDAQNLQEVDNSILETFRRDLPAACFEQVFKTFKSLEANTQKDLVRALIPQWKENPGFFTWKAMSLMLDTFGLNFLLKHIDQNIIDQQAPYKALNKQFREFDEKTEEFVRFKQVLTPQNIFFHISLAYKSVFSEYLQQEVIYNFFKAVKNLGPKMMFDQELFEYIFPEVYDQVKLAKHHSIIQGLFPYQSDETDQNSKLADCMPFLKHQKIDEFFDLIQDFSRVRKRDLNWQLVYEFLEHTSRNTDRLGTKLRLSKKPEVSNTLNRIFYDFIREQKEEKSGTMNSSFKKKVNNIVRGYLKSEGFSHFVPLFEEIEEKVVKGHMLKVEGEFKQEDYQIWIAVGAIYEKATQVMIQIGPGQGKTFIMIIIALYYLYFVEGDQRKDKCVFFTNQEHISMMIKGVAKQYLRLKGDFDTKYFVFTNFQVAYNFVIQRPGEKFVMFFDEGDDVVHKYAIKFCEKELQGLINFSKHKCFYVSATFDEFCETLAHQIFPQNFKLLDYPGAFAVSTGNKKAKSYKLTLSVSKRQAVFEEEIIRFAKARYNDSPIIVFADEDFASKIFSRYETLCQQKSEDVKAKNIVEQEGDMKFYYFSDLKLAQEVLKDHKNATVGVYITVDKLSRGLDMKFGKDSLVICLEMAGKDSKKLTYTEIMQQIGRSSRKRGICIGHILIEGSVYYDQDYSDADTFLDSRKRQADMDALGVLQELLQLYRSGREKTMKAIADNFKDYGSWIKSFDKLEKEMDAIQKSIQSDNNQNQTEEEE